MRAGSCVQLLQSVQRCRRDVFGWRDKGNLTDESAQTVANIKFVGIES